MLICFSGLVIFMHTRQATFIGYTALAIWSCTGTLMAKLTAIPTGETLTIILLAGFIVNALKLTYSHRWSAIKLPWWIWLIGSLLIFGNDILYVAAFHYAPAAPVVLTNYLWPILFIIVSSFLPNESFSLRHLFACILGFSGLYILFHNDQHSFAYIAYLPGYAYALLAGITWCIISLLARYWRDIPSEMMGMYSGIAAIFAVTYHIFYETTIIPNNVELICLISAGISGQGLAYVFWDHGVKRGNHRLLSVLCYFNPIISVSLLVMTDEAEPSIYLALACALVVLGALLGGISRQTFVRFLASCSSKMNLPDSCKSVESR